MLVSVIIPCFNYGNFLPEAIESVLAQSHSNWECVIVDDGSTDNTGAICAKYTSDKRVRYFYKENGGLSSARNFGIEHSIGEFVCFLDADDLLDKDKLKEQLSCFNTYPDTDIVYGGSRFFETNDPQKLYLNKEKTQASGLSTVSGSGNKILKSLVNSNITVVSAPLLRRKVFKVVGGFDLGYRSYEDWHFWLRCALADLKFRYWSKPSICTYIRFGHESMMSDKQKLISAGIQLRRFIQPQVRGQIKLYNLYRLLRSRFKLALIS